MSGTRPTNIAVRLLEAFHNLSDVQYFSDKSDEAVLLRLEWHTITISFFSYSSFCYFLVNYFYSSLKLRI